MTSSDHDMPMALSRLRRSILRLDVRPTPARMPTLGILRGQGGGAR